MNKLITPESPLLVPPLLATEIGMVEAMILQQIHYFTSISSHVKEGKKWFWKTLKDWSNVFPFLSQSKIRRAIANLKDNFKLIDVKRHSEVTWYQANWFTVNVDAVEALWQRIAQNEQIESQDLDISKRSPQATHSIDSSSENYSSSLSDAEKESENLIEETGDDAESNPDLFATILDSSEDKYSAACPEVPKRRTKQQEVWEIAPGRPYPVFVNWRADKHYKPQGGKWESDAHGIAYSEFYKNRDKTTSVLFPQFLEYMKTVAENCNQQLANGIKAILPSCFIARPEATQENVQQLMVNIQQLVDSGVEVALPNPGAPSSTQSISFAAAAENRIIEPLPILGEAGGRRQMAEGEEKASENNSLEHKEFQNSPAFCPLPPALEGMRKIFKIQLHWEVDDERLQWFSRIGQPERSHFWNKLKAACKKSLEPMQKIFDRLRVEVQEVEEEKEVQRAIAWCWLLSMGGGGQ